MEAKGAFLLRMHLLLMAAAVWCADRSVAKAPVENASGGGRILAQYVFYKISAVGVSAHGGECVWSRPSVRPSVRLRPSPSVSVRARTDMVCTQRSDRHAMHKMSTCVAVTSVHRAGTQARPNEYNLDVRWWSLAIGVLVD